MKARYALICVLLLCAGACGRTDVTKAAPAPSAITLEGAKPAAQVGSTGEDRKAGSLYGHVLGKDWGTKAGDYAEYQFDEAAAVSPARLTVRYAREIPGAARFDVTLDGKNIGAVLLPSTGGWGDTAANFQTRDLLLPNLSAGAHTLRLTAAAPHAGPGEELSASPILDKIGGRDDKNSVGHGRNVAIYTGGPSRFFYATQEMGDVFNAADGAPVAWYPDHVLADPGLAPGNANLDQLTIDAKPVTPAAQADAPVSGVTERRQICVTADDVAVSRVILTNTTGAAITQSLEIAGDCRNSADYRGGPGGHKETRRDGDAVILTDSHVFPSVLPHGLSLAIGGSIAPASVETNTPGAYRLRYEVAVPAGGSKIVTLACAFDPDANKAKANLARVLGQNNPLEQNRADWAGFYEKQVPRFECSDPRINEIYGLRWFLLKFSTAGGSLGYFHYPVDMEGREAFQTYCCYSAPFMAFDLNWASDPSVGFGQLANMGSVAYDDGRFPWYATPETNHVHVDHASASGQSLLPWTAWRFYQIHGRKDMIAALYPTMKKDVDWWISDRDPDHNGLFTIDNQLETGMDDLHRRWKGGTPKRYEAIDASCYTYLNLKAVANMARLIGKSADASYYDSYAAKTANAVETILWDPALQRYRDRNPDNGELSDYNSLTIFYPMFAGIARKEHLSVITRYLTNPKEYWTKYPVPALSQTDPEFDPEHRYWAGLTWPATNSHVFEGFADTAKRLDRTQMAKAGELFQRMVALHSQPRADFYEHYHPLTGKPLSNFRDYMHSWWIETIVRETAGLEPQDDGGLRIDPLPMDLKYYALRGARYRGHLVDVLWNDAAAGKGLTVAVDGKVLRRVAAFQPGDAPIVIPAAEIRPK
ncbi:hypothetical protein CCAX7_19970 [Capsulimonas corticalis]|uniref:CBM6 domain-containing protein n=1 Tax=Capsulimonas corticalis TaxID=2219043 RepID=A0A402D2H4_9BACT|nr:trehalase family glycosidase [Capsulimonas corticalis]BDI29946.1 hypothetical protein CCAX7_19970 [Capsulimonas corticalis]